MQNLIINDVEFMAGKWPLESNQDTIVFLHGSGGTNVLWKHQLKELSATMNTVAINLPGHGNSTANGMGQITDFSNFVSEFIDTLDIKKPVICGLSIGGAIVLQLLIDKPGKYKGGTIVNAGAKLKVNPMILHMIENDYQVFVNSIYKFGISQNTKPESIKELAESMLICPSEVTFADFSACNSFDIRQQLNLIKDPTLIITASEDQLTPVKYGLYLAENIINTKHKNIEEAGHLVPLEKPDEVSEIIRSFVTDI